MTAPERRQFGDDARELDEDTWREGVATARDTEANEADLIEQAIAVPDDDSDFDR